MWHRLTRQVPSLIILVILALPAAAPPPTEPVPQGASLAGQLLVASPEIGDPRFEHTVVLLVRHKLSGALGIIINRPLGERPLAMLMDMIGEDTTHVEGRVPLFAGGPVEPEVGFVLHSVDYHRAETLDVGTNLAMTSTREILRDIAHNKGPAKTLIAFGYAGWGPGQLESEMAQRGWFTAPADPALVFDEARGTLWEEAMKRRSRQL
jgi:putative transcriptional regulator